MEQNLPEVVSVPITRRSKQNKLLVILLSVVFLITLLTSVIFYIRIKELTKQLSDLKINSFPTTTDTTKEETCTTCISNEYKISFEVPTGYNGFLKKGDDDFTIFKKYDQPQRTNSWIGISFFPGLYFPVTTCENNNVGFRNVYLNELYHVHLKNIRVGETKIVDGDGSTMDQFNKYGRIDDIKIAGKTATVFINKRIWEGGPDVIKKLYFIENGDSNSFGNYIVAIDALVYPSSNHNEINLDILDQVLTTFKFIE